MHAAELGFWGTLVASECGTTEEEHLRFLEIALEAAPAGFKIVSHLSFDTTEQVLRVVLREAGITWRRTKTWKASRDPDFAIKMASILDLNDSPPTDGRVLCVDEFGPLNLQPDLGTASFGTASPTARHPPSSRRDPADVRRAGSRVGPGVLPLP